MTTRMGLNGSSRVILMVQAKLPCHYYPHGRVLSDLAHVMSLYAYELTQYHRLTFSRVFS
jgi:hypothetical protein